MKKTVLFGAGLNGQVYVENNVNVPVDLLLFCDNNPEKQGSSLCGIEIISFSELTQLYKKGEVERIIVTMASIIQVFKQCIQNGIEFEDLFYYVTQKNAIISIEEIWSDSIFSQDGEETYLKEKFRNKKEGVYVDIGANHPFRFSNTWWAYKKGWKGINIEPDIMNYELLCVARKHDININCGIAARESELDYYVFEENALNTFCCDEIENKKNVKEVRKVPVKRLDSILEKHKIKEICFMDIDVEGMELEVLQSIDWENVTIECLLVEQRGMSLLDVLQSDICVFLKEKGYTPINKYNRTVIYEKGNGSDA